MEKKYIIVVIDKSNKKHYLDASLVTPAEVLELGEVIEYKEVE